MATKAAVVVLVCPQCGKKYKGDANKPDARYQCPADQSTLIRLDTETPPPPKPASEPADSYGFTTDTGAQDSEMQGSTDGMAAQGGEGQDTGFEVERYPAQDYVPRASSLDAPPPPPPPPSAETPPPIPAPSPKQQRPSAVASVVSRAAPPKKEGQSGALSGFEQRRSVVAALERLGAADPTTGERALVYKYEVKNKLGAGGMGEVYKVLDRDLRREVAMKKLRPGSGGLEEDMLRFIKEAQATGRLEHPNIVPVHDLGVDGEGRIYFTLKYVKGLSLKEVIRGRRDATQLEDKRKFRDVFSPRQMIEILIGVCNAVAYAHSKDIIHRDLKPDNVMLGKFGEVLVMDWGLAKILSQHASAESGSQEAFLDLNLRATLDSSMTMEGAIAGTPAYMSPEQAAGKISELDQRTDIYALGSILYEILSGEPPYKGATALEVVRMVTEGPPAPLSSGVYGFRPIPRELKAITEKAMAREPSNRYVFAEQLRDDLTAYLEDQPVSACPDTALQKGVKWIRRNRQRVTSVVTTIILAMLVIGAGWFGYRQYRVGRILSAAELQAHEGKKQFESYKSTLQNLHTDDPYQLSLQTVARTEVANQYRERLNQGIDGARAALDLSPDSTRARSFLAESYMELWRLALAENNEPLMSAYSAEVLRYAPDPAQYRHELEGLGSLKLTVDPADADVYLFRFETLHAKDAQGNQLPPRLIPVPFDPSGKAEDSAFLQAEETRSVAGFHLPDSARSIFRFDAAPGSRLGSGSVAVNGLPPGSYMLMLTSLGHAETHMPFVVERMGTVTRTIAMPEVHDVPPGFVYIDGGPAVMGGGAAVARAKQTIDVAPFLLQQDEVTMGDYAPFLKAIGKEADKRMPREAGKPIAKLTADGLVPTDGSDAAKFAASPLRSISNEDAVAYAAWRTQHDGIAYRLPTESEWECACRGPDGRRYSWGNFPGQGLAVTAENGDLMSVPSLRWQDYKDESPWGIHNMAGSVAEWTSSKYTEKSSDPNFGAFTVKGNAFSQQPQGLECAFRAAGQPGFVHPTIGLRLAADWPLKRTGTPQVAEPKQEEQPAQQATPKGQQPKKPKMTHSEEVLHKLGLDK